jgi:ABC-type uncharacterized transport system permease subunit
VLTGAMTTGDLLFGFAVQAAWVAAFIVAVRVVWRAAMRSYSAVGA